ncbi:HTH_Tnp_Tc3_2 domain-containing protein [Trichonephila clavipes]|uniref:HTH_Tnp_Tc3_2 domain-containing protein n=1 Tax=Trichonephila clavipes TaxID=2585209 RepID=A0A8X6SNE0_TRICX|nr:HTH_Tnp_Tc3_2 domain-containing protein [Trichonephila clavipes]
MGCCVTELRYSLIPNTFHSDVSFVIDFMPSTEESENKDAECIFCSGKFSEDHRGKISFQCSSCFLSKHLQLQLLEDGLALGSECVRETTNSFCATGRRKKWTTSQRPSGWLLMETPSSSCGCPVRTVLNHKTTLGSIPIRRFCVARRPVPGRPRATTPAEDRFLALSARRRRTTTVPQLVADHFQASGRRISATTVRNRLHNAGLYARRPVVCVPSTDDSEGTAYAGQENMFLGRSNNGLLCCSQTSPDLQWSVIQGVY